MGRYDAEIERARQMLAKAEAEYADRSIKLTGAAASVRDFVLGEAQGRIDEAKGMIETFSQAND